MNFSEEHNEQHRLYIITNRHKEKIVNILNSKMIYDKPLAGQSGSETLIFSILHREYIWLQFDLDNKVATHDKSFSTWIWKGHLRLSQCKESPRLKTGTLKQIYPKHRLLKIKEWEPMVEKNSP